MGCGASTAVAVAPAPRPDVGHFGPPDGQASLGRPSAGSGSTTVSKFRLQSSLASRSLDDCAVSLSWLLEFADTVPDGKSTAEVVSQIIRPATAKLRCRYVDLIKDQKRSVGHVQWYVSHRWGAEFKSSLVQQLSRHHQRQAASSGSAAGSDDDDVYVWIDIFAVNQHQAPPDLGQLLSVLQAARGTLLVLEDGGAPLTRLWCLWEAWQTGQHKDGSALRSLTHGLDFSSVLQALHDVDVGAAETSEACDKQRLLDDLTSRQQQQQQQRGEENNSDAGAGSAAADDLRAVSSQVVRAVVDGAVAAAEAAAAASAQSPAADEEEARWRCSVEAELLSQAGRMCQAVGRLEEAEPLLKRAVEACKRAKGEEHHDTATHMQTLAALMTERGRLEEAEELHERASSICSKVLGPKHRDTLRSRNALADLVVMQSREASNNTLAADSGGHNHSTLPQNG